jgi:hypothetical protein
MVCCRKCGAHNLDKICWYCGKSVMAGGALDHKHPWETNNIKIKSDDNNRNGRPVGYQSRADFHFMERAINTISLKKGASDR